MARLWLTLLAVLVAACGPPGDFAGENIDGVVSTRVGESWVFHHDPESGMDAIVGGELRISGGCLLVGDTVVVWDADVIVRERGGRVTVDVGDRRYASGDRVEVGGGFGWEAGDEGTAPAPISERCPRRSVFYMAP